MGTQSMVRLSLLATLCAAAGFSFAEEASEDGAATKKLAMRIAVVDCQWVLDQYQPFPKEWQKLRAEMVAFKEAGGRLVPIFCDVGASPNLSETEKRRLATRRAELRKADRELGARTLIRLREVIAAYAEDNHIDVVLFDGSRAKGPEELSNDLGALGNVIVVHQSGVDISEEIVAALKAADAKEGE